MYVSLEEMCSKQLVTTGWYTSVGLGAGHLARFSEAAKLLHTTSMCCLLGGPRTLNPIPK